MKKMALIAPIAVFGMVGFPQSVFSQERPSGLEAFVGGGIGYYRLNDGDFLDEDERLKDDRLSVKVFGGIEISRILGLELGYVNFGEAEGDVTSLNADGWTVAGILALPITENFAPYGKFGRLHWDADVSAGPISRSDSGEDNFYGVGARFALSEQLDLRIEYERFDLADTDLDMASANLQIRF
ncbi:hypothetical protein CAI21_11370 [Alkalilimnicola ehrlichii]|uniref:Outer membrane protein beta-barrel domain-containing protein n=1 Tax=Alkalilimnicola ehrlichii TaxID=351052 RepID=A0A3E0X371_9GAMM|nr:outer membrane beta-barrel protein [Alkalilimnicola ehrlichii]RFA29037.1 hypothetical protein CAI21_11370 [Alkalilimnicola ehrlichii]RFA38674.1 hypothetical protein CAL65_04925 [Alkalilimnicola ehrlichii]